MVVWKIGPVFAMGNMIVLKPSKFTSLTMLCMVPLLKEVGIPAGIVNIVNSYSHIASPAIAEHPGNNISRVLVVYVHMVENIFEFQYYKCTFGCVVLAIGNKTNGRSTSLVQFL